MRAQVSLEIILSMSLALALSLSLVYLFAHSSAITFSYTHLLSNYSADASNSTSRLMQQCGCFTNGV